jgi:hypothetical protein
MDEITLFSTLRPEPASDLGPLRQQAEARLDQVMRRTKPGRAPAARRNRLLLAGAVALAACAAIVAPAVIPGNHAASPGNDAGSFITAAWAVQPNPDGSVSVTLKDVGDPAGLQRALRSDGIQADVVSPPLKAAWVNGTRMEYATCMYPLSGRWFASPQIQQAAVTWNPSVAPANNPASNPAGSTTPTGTSGEVAIIHPSAMPSGSVLFIVDTATDAVSIVSRPVVLKSDRLPACRPVSKP